MSQTIACTVLPVVNGGKENLLVKLVHTFTSEINRNIYKQFTKICIVTKNKLLFAAYEIFLKEVNFEILKTTSVALKP